MFCKNKVLVEVWHSEKCLSCSNPPTKTRLRKLHIVNQMGRQLEWVQISQRVRPSVFRFKSKLWKLRGKGSQRFPGVQPLTLCGSPKLEWGFYLFTVDWHCVRQRAKERQCKGDGFQAINLRVCHLRMNNKLEKKCTSFLCWHYFYDF